MPVINITMHKVDAQMKSKLINRLTESAVEVTGLPIQTFTILIQELDEVNIGLAGRTLKDIKSGA